MQRIKYLNNHCKNDYTQKKQRLELFFKMEKTFLQSHDFVTEVSSASPNNGCDETSVAVANLTSLLDKSQSLSPEPNVSMEQVRTIYLKKKNKKRLHLSQIIITCSFRWNALHLIRIVQ